MGCGSLQNLKYLVFNKYAVAVFTSNIFFSSSTSVNRYQEVSLKEVSLQINGGLAVNFIK